jgi:hypothetical protein
MSKAPPKFKKKSQKEEKRHKLSIFDKIEIEQRKNQWPHKKEKPIPNK